MNQALCSLFQGPDLDNFSIKCKWSRQVSLKSSCKAGKEPAICKLLSRYSPKGAPYMTGVILEPEHGVIATNFASEVSDVIGEGEQAIAVQHHRLGIFNNVLTNASVGVQVLVQRIEH